MNGLVLIFPVAVTQKLSCAFLRLATTASVTPIPTTVATIHRESVSTSRLEGRPLMPKGVQGPLSRRTQLHLPTRLPGTTLEHAGPRQHPQKVDALTSSNSTSWGPGSKKSAYASINYTGPWCKTGLPAGTEVRLEAAPGTLTAASARTKGGNPPVFSTASQNVMAAALLLRAMPEPSTPKGRRVRQGLRGLLK